MEMLTQHGDSPGRVHIGVGKAGTPLQRGHYCSLSSTWYSGEVARTSSPAQAQQRVVGDVQTPVTYESQLSIGVGAAVDSSHGLRHVYS